MRVAPRPKSSHMPLVALGAGGTSTSASEGWAEATPAAPNTNKSASELRMRPILARRPQIRAGDSTRGALRRALARCRT